jgi:hypothetical protein
MHRQSLASPARTLAPVDRQQRSGRQPERRGCAAGAKDRKIRRDALLDQALKDTFPASDPVSVAFIR